MTPAEAMAKYGRISEGGVWEDERIHCSLFNVPMGIAMGWINTATGKPTRHIYCLTAMQPALAMALYQVSARGLLPQLKTFDGCYAIRDVRGVPGVLSAHSYAGALDINAATNKIGTVGTNTTELAACFTDQGFTWGATFSRVDPMHFSWLGW